jgi:hypothetical protein
VEAALAEWIEKFSFGLVADSVQRVSVAGYSDEGERLLPNIRDVPKYAAVQQADEREPGMRHCYLVRGRMHLKFFCEEGDSEVLSLLKKVKRAGVSPSAMHDAVDESNTLEDCFVSMGIERFEFRTAMGQTDRRCSTGWSSFHQRKRSCVAYLGCLLAQDQGCKPAVQ